LREAVLVATVWTAKLEPVFGASALRAIYRVRD
jgi:hypothetical protein